MNRLEPGNVLRALADLLQRRGIIGLCGAVDPALGVLSVAEGLTVWTDGRLLWWQHEGATTTWPAADPDGAAARLAALARRPENPPLHPARRSPCPALLRQAAIALGEPLAPGRAASRLGEPVAAWARGCRAG